MTNWQLSVKPRHLCLAGTACGALLIIQPAQAQVQAQPPAQAGAQEAAPVAASDTADGDIIVTAQRRAERLQDIPISITAFTGKALEQRGALNIATIGRDIPNVELRATTRPTGGGSAVAVFIRGVGTGDYNFPTDPAIGLYVDGVYYSRTIGGLMSLVSIDRIEVLKGPQGTLFGRNTIGGAINIVTKTPAVSGKATGSVSVRVGSYGRRDLLADISTPLVTDRLGLQFAVATFNSDGWAKRPIAGDKIATEGRFVTRGALHFDATEKFTMDLRADYTRQRQKPGNFYLYQVTPTALVNSFNASAASQANGVYGLPAGSIYDSRWISNDPLVNNGTFPEADDSDIGGASLTMDYAVSPSFEVKTITAYRKLRSFVSIDNDQTPYNISASQETIHHRQFSQEIQLSGKLLDDHVTYVAGGYYSSEAGSLDKNSLLYHGLYQATGLATQARDTTTRIDYSARSLAVFAQVTGEILHDFHLTLGARLNKDIKDFAVTTQLTETGTVTVPLRLANDTWTSFTPRIAADWKIATGLMVYASFSQGFKSGGFGQPTATVPIVTYNPERLKTVEVGFKSQFWGNRVTFNAAAFHSDWNDIQLNVIATGPTGNLISITQNGGNARLRGFEMDLSARPVDPLRLHFNLGHVDPKFVSLTPGAIAGGLTLATQLPNISRWTWNTGAQLTLESGVGTFVLGGDVSRRSSQYLVVNSPTSFTEGYTLLSANVSFTPAAVPGLTFWLEGTNLTNKLYTVYDLDALAQIGLRQRAYGEPRMIFVRAKYAF